jgi:serine/threonine protein phosphatase PrpC
MSIHSVSLKGRRDSNEDKHTVKLGLNSNNNTNNNINFYAIYDGHGGKFVSNYLHNNLHTFFIDRRVKYPLKKSFVNKAFDCVQKNLEMKYPNQSESCGSTCLAMVHYKEPNTNNYYVNVMNAGDCRGVMCRNNIALRLTKDHKPNTPEERHRITNLGGEIYFDGYDWRINDLSVSRAFGDNESKAYVTHIPDLFKYKLSRKDKFIIMGCDGLWDVMTDQDVVDFILSRHYDMSTGRKIDKKMNIAKQLGEYAIQHGSTDNITILIIFLED